MFRLLPVVLVLLLSGTVFAQEIRRPVSVSVGYGLITAPQIIESVTDILGTALTGGNVRYDDGSFSGAIVANIKIPTRSRVTFGADVAYESFKKDVYSTSSGAKLGTSEGRYVSVIPRADFYWLDKRAARLYSGVAVGASFASQKYESDKANSVLLAFNLVPIGVELGTTISVFGEAAFGYNGLVHAGLRLRL